MAVRRSAALILMCGLAAVFAAVPGNEAARGADIAPLRISPAPVSASCSGYYSDVMPPSTILLYDNLWGSGRLYSIDFRLYLKQVLPREWDQRWPMGSLQSGAMGVMTFSWYQALRAKDTGDGRCYEISLRQQNGWCNPWDIPENEPWRCTTVATTDEAVDSIFAPARTMRRGQIMQGYYKAGSPSDGCGQWYAQGPPPPDYGQWYWANAPGDDMSQNGTVACANQGLMWHAILRRYYFDNPAVGYEGRAYGAHGDAQGHVTVLDDGPAATAYTFQNDQLQVYAIGRDGAVWEKIYRFSTRRWYPSRTGWSTRGAPPGGCSGGPPAAAGVWSYGRLYVLCRGSDGAIWFKYWNGSVWSAWDDVPGGSGFQSGPAATAYAQPGGYWHLQVYAVGWDGGMYEQLYDFGTGQWWGGWNPLYGQWTSAPAAMGLIPDLWVAARGQDGGVYVRRWNGSSWTWWESLAGIAVGGPALTYHYQSGPGWSYRAYHTGLDAAVYEKRYWASSQTWDPPDRWDSMSGVKASSPAAAGYLGASPYYLYVLARGQDELAGGTWNGGLIWFRRCSGSQCNSPQSWEWWADIGRPP